MSGISRRFGFARLFTQFLRLVFVAVTVVFASRVNAQTLMEGSRVQITTHGAARATGVVKTVTGDSTTIFVEGNGGVLRFANRDITEVRISSGKSGTLGAKKGALLGAEIGGALAVALVASVEAFSSANKDGLFAYAAQTVIGTTMWGAGIGAFVGAERWDKVPVPASRASSSRGVGLSIAFRPSFLN